MRNGVDRALQPGVSAAALTAGLAMAEQQTTTQQQQQQQEQVAGLAGAASAKSEMVDEVLEEQELSLVQRIVSASTGALLTSLLVTPLDVVKIRLQAQGEAASMCSEPRSAAQCARCSHYSLHNGLMDVMLPKSMSPGMFHCPQHQAEFTSTLDAVIKISRYEGVGALYNGLRPSLIMAVPSTVLYFATYDKLRAVMLTEYGLGDTLSPLLAGSSSRTLAATVIAPLELVRTKMQAMNTPPSMLRLARDQVRDNGLRSLWRGLSPTLFRDVPFSAIYWVCVEKTRERVRPLVASQCNIDHTLQEFTASFVAGATGGFVAATATNPFDVVKTRRQVFDFTVGTEEASARQDGANLRIVRRVLEKEGLAGFWAGLVPRLGKIVPACAIMLSSYEAGKKFFLRG